MLCGIHSSSHECCSHACRQTAPQPHAPEASEEKMTVGVHFGLWTSIMLRAFQTEMKVSHQAKSAWNSASSLTQWFGCLAFVDRSIMRLKKARPGCTTLQACESFPTSDSNSRFLQAFLYFHSLISAFNFSSFCSGRRISLRSVSNAMPKNVSTADGPSIFSLFNGTPSHSQVLNINSRLSLHSVVSGWPIVRKSSM